MYETYGMTDVGKVRENNEDYFLTIPEKGLYIVADGMGGHRAGDIASLYATKAVNDYLTKELLSKIQGNEEKIKEELCNSVHCSNRTVIDYAKNNPRFKDMGCAIVVALIDTNILHLCHVGDTRAYVSSGGELKRLTTDHTTAMSLVKQNLITEEEALKSPMHHILSQAIGRTGIEPEYGRYLLNKKDRILLCSDGLWDMLPENNIYDILMQDSETKNICENLIQKANDAGGKDNISAVVICNSIANENIKTV